MATWTCRGGGTTLDSRGYSSDDIDAIFHENGLKYFRTRLPA